MQGKLTIQEGFVRAGLVVESITKGNVADMATYTVIVRTPGVTQILAIPAFIDDEWTIIEHCEHPIIPGAMIVVYA